jgi:4'-phosphopantetheinyl transferase
MRVFDRAAFSRPLAAQWLYNRDMFTLADDEVHVWHACVDDLRPQLEALEALLNKEERARAARFHFPRDRHQFSAARGMLRSLLAAYTGLSAAGVPLEYSSSGKPSLPLSVADGLHFNLAHSHLRIVAAFARGRRVGIDVEWMRELRDSGGIVERYFSPDEVAAYRMLPAQARSRGFFNGWTRKEAFVKALGDGLGRSLAAFTVSLTPGEPTQLLAVPSDQATAAWTLCEVTIDPAYVCALVAEGGRYQVCLRNFSVDAARG